MKNFGQLKNYFTDSLVDQYELREINSFFFLLIEDVKKWNKVDFTLQRKLAVTNAEDLIFQNAINSLRSKVPIQYIIGHVVFYDLHLKVNKNVLIPRPETEELIRFIKYNNTAPSTLNILDIGTGSGCIILALKRLFMNSNCLGIDISRDAIEIAKKNAKNLDLEVCFSTEDIFNYRATKKFDLIVSNPPYITESEKKLMDSNVLDYEPHGALFVKDANPLLYYRRIGEFGIKNLNNNGQIYFEINEKFGNDVVYLLKELGYENCSLKKDFQEKNRFVSAVLK
jgi:release factor glutamine methyltransferase